MLRTALTLVLVLTLGANAQQSPFAEVLAEAKKIHREDGLRCASIGIALIPLDAEDASSLAGYRPDTALVPASTMKVVTTGAAVDLLGPEFTFTTTLQHTGTITEEGSLQGDLIVKGGGDPTLGDTLLERTFTKWQSALTEAGIKKIEGRILGDASLFGTQLRPDGWQWADLGNYYAAGACGLTIHQNQFFCRFRTGSAGTVAEFLGTDPVLPGLTIANEVRVGAVGSGDQGYVYGAPYANLLYLRGTVPERGSSFTIRGALPDPAYFCAQAFRSYLENNDLPVSGEASTLRLLELAGQKVSGERKTFLEQSSEPLSKLILTTNHRSDNLYAECIHRMIGVHRNKEGSTLASSKAVTDHWSGKGIDLTGFHMADGSGLSRTNTITARQLTLMLYHLAKSEHFATFSKSLPVAGKSGTMRSIGRGSPVEGRVRAKSGSMERVKAYCGYVHAKSGKRYAFAILFNNFSGQPGPLKPKVVRVWKKIVAL